VSKIPTELKFDASIISDLACPACHGDLRLYPKADSLSEAPTNEGRLLCAACGRAYPIIDGIPVLIVERAEMTAKPQ
jgi:uncharacterized protein YbaR (Trm112 family)